MQPGARASDTIHSRCDSELKSCQEISAELRAQNATNAAGTLYCIGEGRFGIYLGVGSDALFEQIAAKMRNPRFRSAPARELAPLRYSQLSVR